MNYLKKYKKMIVLRGLTEHTVKSYSTYIGAFIDYNNSHLHKYMSQINYNDLREFITFLQLERNLNDRTINAVISSSMCSTDHGIHLNFHSENLTHTCHTFHLRTR